MISHVCFAMLRNVSPPGSSVQGLFQARILEWVAISSISHLQTHLLPSSLPGISILQMQKFLNLDLSKEACQLGYQQRNKIPWWLRQ